MGIFVPIKLPNIHDDEKEDEKDKGEVELSSESVNRYVLSNEEEDQSLRETGNECERLLHHVFALVGNVMHTVVGHGEAVAKMGARFSSIYVSQCPDNQINGQTR